MQMYERIANATNQPAPLEKRDSVSCYPVQERNCQLLPLRDTLKSSEPTAYPKDGRG